MKLPWPLISALALYSIANGAAATTIVVDPGPVGTERPSYSLPFADLNGTPLDGETISLDFVFDDMKHVEVAPLVNTGYLVNLQIVTGKILSTSTPAGTAFLSDENGDPLFPASDVVARSNANSGSWIYSFDTPLTHGLLHHDVHFRVSLPTIAGEIIESGLLRLGLAKASRDPLLKVGEWTPMQSVPEPTTILLLSLGLAGIARRNIRTVHRRPPAGAAPSPL